jgi:branched-chain amino acid aminotransferase
MLAYVNGDFVPEAEAKISIWDRGFTIGEGVFEGWRTFGGRSVQLVLDKHLTRLRRSIRYLEMDPRPVIERVAATWPQIVERNKEEIHQGGDVFVRTIVTAGRGPELLERSNPTITIAPYAIPFKKVFSGDLYTAGARLVPSMMTLNPFMPADPRVKSISRLSNARAERKQVRNGPRSWAVTFDNQGFITEASAAALAVVEDGCLVMPPRWSRLESVSLQIACDICRDLKIQIEERPLTMFDLLNADEVHIFGTTIAMVHVAEIDGIVLDTDNIVGAKILKRWIELVGFDFVDQSRRLTGPAEMAHSAKQHE